jgi:hypothetical protein
MPAPDTQKIMDLVEQKTGYRVSVSVDSTITTHVAMVSASSSVPVHVVKVNPKYEKYGDYLVAIQSAMLLIKWGDPKRIPDFAILEKKVGYIKDKFEKQVMAKGIPKHSAHQYANMIVMGILQQLNSLPIQMFSMDMVAGLAPGLRLLQEESVNNELREASASFTTQVKEITPKEIFERNAAMNAAYAINWSKISGDTIMLLPYQSLGYISRGEKLLEKYEALSTKRDPDRYIETVDAWAEELKMATWYEWRYRKAE